MSDVYIDPTVFEAVEGKPIPKEHRAKRYAASLPDTHPVKQLFTGSVQWLGDSKYVFGFLHLFCEIYEEHLRRADDNGFLRTVAPLDQAAIILEDAEFERLFPDDVLFRGRRYSLRALLRKARDAVAHATREFPPLRTIGLAAFDRTFATLVRAVRMS